MQKKRPWPEGGQQTSRQDTADGPGPQTAPGPGGVPSPTPGGVPSPTPGGVPSPTPGGVPSPARETPGSGPGTDAAGIAEAAEAAEGPGTAEGTEGAGAAGADPAPPAPVVPEDPAPQPPVGRGRRTRVRTRLLLAVAVVAAATAGAGAPGALDESRRVADSQRLVDDAGRARQALSLAHALSDERDELTAWVAGGRSQGEAPAAAHRAPVDRQIAELRTGAPAGVRRALDRIADVRRSAVSSSATALQVHEEYAGVITGLHKLSEDLADRVPARAGLGAHALADLDTAVEQAEAARGLLLAALAVPSGPTTVVDPATGIARTVAGSPSDVRHRDELTAAARLARVREQAAFAAFRDRAPGAWVTSYDNTVTGPHVSGAEKDLDRLTDEPRLSSGELGTDRKKLATSLTARIDVMRGAEASLNVARGKELAALRDSDVTALEIRIALAGVCLLAAVGVAMAAARTLTRPLAVLRLGSARLAAEPGTGEPVGFTGRNDEFAQVVRSVNTLHAHAAQLRDQLAQNTSGTGRAAGTRAGLGAGSPAAVLRTAVDAAADGLAGAGDRDARGAGPHDRKPHAAEQQDLLVPLAQRTLGMVERQLAAIESLEEKEHDPDRLALLFTLDHLATVTRRHGENLLVLAGAERTVPQARPVPLVDMVRAAVSEVERYERVRIAALPPQTWITGAAADDLAHVLAELMENGAAFSAPDAPVEVSGWLLESGYAVLSVTDGGVGMTEEQLVAANALLAGGEAQDVYVPVGAEGAGPGLGLLVVARLARRHGVRVLLRSQAQGGLAASVVLPTAVLDSTSSTDTAPPRRAVPPPHRPAAATAPAAARQPGAAAEANDNHLPPRRRPPAEAVAHIGADADSAPGPAPGTPAHGTPLPAAHHATNPYAIGPDDHEHVPDHAGTPGPEATHGGPADEEATVAPLWDRAAGSGLPQRTPRVPQNRRVHGRPAAVPSAVQAEQLRRMLDGFQQGAREGRRDGEQDAAVTAPRVPAPVHSADDTALHPTAPGPAHGSDSEGAARATDTALARGTAQAGDPARVRGTAHADHGHLPAEPIAHADTVEEASS